ncbi:hypothetical protein EVAR_61212_1 [Eumeta japonica]|uniref:Uncharacterized protein n=1 Tax=Eumeta variegata TaxID=151549 RepID=A0A4C1YYL6_EUMVA|nr:hypothetical protein EVAR_61212_1 [Eumeta japonica]
MRHNRSNRKTISSRPIVVRPPSRQAAGVETASRESTLFSPAGPRAPAPPRPRAACLYVVNAEKNVRRRSDMSRDGMSDGEMKDGAPRTHEITTRRAHPRVVRPNKAYKKF